MGRLHGDTYPHRDLLKRWGCRWSKKRRCWYYIGETLPDAVQALIEAQNQSSDDQGDPCPVEEAAAILGMSVKDLSPSPAEQPSSDGAQRLFALNETVYARHDLVSSDDSLSQQAHAGRSPGCTTVTPHMVGATI
jgi:hypothetical protein